MRFVRKNSVKTFLIRSFEEKSGKAIQFNSVSAFSGLLCGTTVRVSSESSSLLTSRYGLRLAIGPLVLTSFQ